MERAKTRRRLYAHSKPFAEKKTSSFPFLRHTVYSVGAPKFLTARENRGRLYAYSKPLKNAYFLWHTV